ncbi:MAG: YkgJ family cysteine cluster protein [Nitrospirota bacterium]
MGKVPTYTISQCRRCGTCCRKGGPILHREDRKILFEGFVGHQHLMTIRKGERAFNPVTEKVGAVPIELVRVMGKGTGRTCFFFDEERASCRVYEHRFLECRLLQCWDPSQIMQVIGRNTLSRFDLINPDDPIVEVIGMHDRDCPGGEVEDLASNSLTASDRADVFRRLSSLVRKDEAIRSYALDELGMKKEYELFIFGRPIRQILRDYGLRVSAG